MENDQNECYKCAATNTVLQKSVNLSGADVWVCADEAGCDERSAVPAETHNWVAEIEALWDGIKSGNKTLMTLANMHSPCQVNNSAQVTCTECHGQWPCRTVGVTRDGIIGVTNTVGGWRFTDGS